VIYIGQSKRPYHRACTHFSKYKNKSVSNVANAIVSGELKRENLTYDVVEYIEDRQLRIQREREYIDMYKPKYNIQ